MYGQNATREGCQMDFVAGCVGLFAFSGSTFEVRCSKLSKGVRGGKWKTKSMNTKSCYLEAFLLSTTWNLELQTSNQPCLLFQNAAEIIYLSEMII